MRPLLLLAFALALVSLPVQAHGGIWKPPQPKDVVPPGAWKQPTTPAGGSGVGSPTSPGTGGLGGAPPSGAQPAGASTPGAGLPAAPTTPGTMTVSELSDWSYWWYFNREPLLDLRRRFGEQGHTTGESAGQKAVPDRPGDVQLLKTVLPALFALSGPDSQDNLRLTAGIALARIGGPDGEGIRAALEAQLAARDPRVQEAALLGLGLTGEYWALETLRAVLADEREARELLGGRLGDRERAFAIYALGVMGARAPHDAHRTHVLEPLWQTLTDRKADREVRVAAANAIGMTPIGWDASGAGDEVDPDAVPRSRGELIERLWALYLGEGDVFVRAHLGPAMARLAADAPDEVRDALVARFLERIDARRGPRSQDLHGLVIGLGVMGQAWGRASDTALRQQLYTIAREERDAHARHMAVMALATVIGRSGASLPPPPVQAEFEAFLVESLRDADARDQGWLALAAGVLGAHLAAPVEGRPRGVVGEDLLAELRALVAAEGSPDSLAAAVLALGLAEDFKSAETVERLFDDTRSRDLRGYAALALGLLGTHGTQPKLELFLDDARYDPIALEHGALGLALLSRPRAITALTERLGTAQASVSAAPLAATLGRIGNASAVPDLVALAATADQALPVRENAILALGLIARPFALTWRAALATDANYAAWVPTLYDQAGLGILNIN